MKELVSVNGVISLRVRMVKGRVVVENAQYQTPPIGLYEERRWKAVAPKIIPEWIRVVIAKLDMVKGQDRYATIGRHAVVIAPNQKTYYDINVKDKDDDK